MNEKKIVSVIVPTYKRSENLDTSIKSLLKQTYPNIEIIIVDDNGAENDSERLKTKAKVKELQEKHNNLYYIALEKNSGAAVARNHGIENAKGDYICFLDDDDTYHVDKIERQVTIFDSLHDDNIAFVKCEMAYIYPGGRKVETNKEKYFLGNQFVNHIVDQHAMVGTPTFMFKKSALLSVNGFYNTPIRQEYMLLLKILSKGFKGYYHSDVLVDINTSFDGISVGKNDKKALSLERIYKERLKFSNILTDEQIIFMEHQYVIDMIKWYSNYNFSKAIQTLFSYRHSMSYFELIKHMSLIIAKYSLGNNFYKIKYFLRK